jgi:hypothetical protein
LKEKLGEWDQYNQVFDPTQDADAVHGSLADDLADIYRDLKEGLVLKETKLRQPEDLIWEWRFAFHSHWGKHAMDALLTIHFRLQQRCLDRVLVRGPKKRYRDVAPTDPCRGLRVKLVCS